MSGPLDGIRILDLTRVVMGPYATQILADQGAEVIMVEEAHGDTNRVMGAGPTDELSGVALNLLRGKRSAVIDLKSDAGRDAVSRLVATCDVVVATMRPAALERLHLTYDDLRPIRPDLIYCQGQGFPLESEQRNAPAYDDIIQAASGVADVTGRVFEAPYLLPTVFADKVSGLYMAQAITAALLHRERTGEGQHIEVAMTEATAAFLLVEHGSAAISEPPVGPAGYKRILSRERRPSPTRDGWIHILPYTPDHYRRLFELIGYPVDPELYATRRATLQNSDQLYALTRELMSTRTTQEWLDYCREQSIPATPVATIQDLVDALPITEHPTAGRYRLTPSGARFSATPFELRRPAPGIGEHTDEILAEVADPSGTVDPGPADSAD